MAELYHHIKFFRLSSQDCPNFWLITTGHMKYFNNVMTGNISHTKHLFYMLVIATAYIIRCVYVHILNCCSQCCGVFVQYTK